MSLSENAITNLEPMESFPATLAGMPVMVGRLPDRFPGALEPYDYRGTAIPITREASMEPVTERIAQTTSSGAKTEALYYVATDHKAADLAAGKQAAYVDRGYGELSAMQDRNQALSASITAALGTAPATATNSLVTLTHADLTALLPSLETTQQA